MDLFLSKWQRREIEQPDDWTASDWCSSTFSWEGVQPCCNPWKVLKAIWRSEQIPCPNCGQPELVTFFGLVWCGMFNRQSRWVRVCLECRRRYEETGGDVVGWMKVNLERRLLPGYSMGWGKPYPLQLGDVS